MTALVQQVAKKRKPSKEIKLSKAFLDALEAIPKVDFEKLQPKVDRVFKIGRSEALTDKQIGKYVRAKMKEHYSGWTINSVLPDTAKRSGGYKKRNEVSSFQEHEDQQESQEIWQIKPEQYDSNDLDRYDKTMLIKIIKWYEEQQDKLIAKAQKWDNERSALLDKIAKLEAR